MARRIVGILLLAWALWTTWLVAAPQRALYVDVPLNLLQRLVMDSPRWGLYGAPHLTLAYTLAVLGGMALLGRAYLRLRKMPPLPMAARPALMLLVGLALLAVPLELLAIGFMLHRWSIVLVVLLVAGALWALRRRACPAPQATPQTTPQSSEDIAPCHPILRRGIWGVIGGFTLLSFFHALMFPVTYWDALILYVNYARMTYEQNGFPVLVQLQVGLGLGANYPHLYPLMQACMALLVGIWSDGYGQAIPPICGLLSTLLVYRMCAERFASQAVGLLAALLFCTTPYVFHYNIYASDYALAMLLATALLYLVQRAARPGQERLLEPALLICALAPHLNYLMWALWLPLAVVAGHLLRQRRVSPRGLAVTAMICLALASTWYARNWIVTGNPVYAFFPGVFGGKHIDPEVLASCEVEWTRNSDGIGRYAGPSVWQRISRTPDYFLFERGAPGQHFPGLAYKTANLIPGFAASGLLLLCIAAARRGDNTSAGDVAQLAFLGLILFYQYVLSGLYLYHTLIAFPVLALAAGAVFDFVRTAWARRGVVEVACAVVVGLGVLVPGAGSAIIGPKFHSPGLQHWLMAGQPPQYTWMTYWPDTWRMWMFINERLAPGEPVILTHENRHHYLDTRVALMHLDDYRLLDVYDRDFEQVVLPRLRELGVTHYLRVPNEDNHPITARLGHEAYFEQQGRVLTRFGDQALYALPVR